MPKKLAGNLGYNEVQEKINIRINAHKKFSNLSLEDWLGENLSLNAGNSILDLGCGNGNFFPVYEKQIKERGLIVGMDKSTELLSRASNIDTNCRKILLELDLDQEWPIFNSIFDLAISTFAIYYASSVNDVLRKINDLLLPSARLCLIGPTSNNAAELYEYNKSVFGFDRSDKIETRTTRLENEFLPECRNTFGRVETRMIASKLVFPDRNEFIKYYCASLLFEESSKAAGREPSWDELAEKATETPELSKGMIAIWSYK
jgi:SAM-dependent methyltransferase